MSDEDRYRSLLTGPIGDREPELLKDLPTDNLVGALVVLAGEIHALRSRLQNLESLLEAGGTLSPGAVEHHEPPAETAARMRQDLDAFVTRFWQELARSGASASRVDPRAKDYFDGS